MQMRSLARPILHIETHYRSTDLPIFRNAILPVCHPQQARTMKRKASQSPERKSKAVKLEDYCSIQPVKDIKGNPIWPAPEQQIRAAKEFLRKW